MDKPIPRAWGVFILRGLRKNKNNAYFKGQCSYNTPSGDRCAVGRLAEGLGFPDLVGEARNLGLMASSLTDQWPQFLEYRRSLSYIQQSHDIHVKNNKTPKQVAYEVKRFLHSNNTVMEKKTKS